MSQSANPRRMFGRLSKVLWTLAMLAFVPAILMFFFGFFIKTSDEYDCAMRILAQDPVVIREIGDPIKPGLFAWTLYFESGGGVRQGAFSTSISGQESKGKVRVEFYRTPIGATLYVHLKAKTGETDVYDGPYPCP